VNSGSTGRKNHRRRRTLSASNSRVYRVTGATRNQKIKATYGSRSLLRFSSTPKVADGENLKLNAFSKPRPETTLTLACDGPNWYEIARAKTRCPTVNPVKPERIMHLGRRTSRQQIVARAVKPILPAAARLRPTARVRLVAAGGLAIQAGDWRAGDRLESVWGALSGRLSNQRIRTPNMPKGKQETRDPAAPATPGVPP